MNPDTRNMTMTEKVEAACKQAAAKVIERARQTGTPVILWEDGRIIKRSWDELIDEPTKDPVDSPIARP
jgi:Ribonuclease G/E